MERRRCDAEELNTFFNSGLYRISGDSNVVFLDPVRLLNESYSRFRLSPSAYYSRLFPSQTKPPREENAQEEEEFKLVVSDKKRKRKKTKVNNKHLPGPEHICLNEKELCAERRHQKVKPLLLDAHKKLLESTEILNVLPEIIKSKDPPLPDCSKMRSEHNFIEIGSNWRAGFCEISLPQKEVEEGLSAHQSKGRRLVPLFNNIINIDIIDDIEAEFNNIKYILPKRSNFIMSDLRQVHKLIPDKSTDGFNLIVIDPPWENASARQKSLYPTLPNKHFLYLPVKKLAHSNGALVALWITNREKMQDFVFNELFPSWGVTNVVCFYWLKVKTDGSMIGDLDIFHHRPYECVLLGYINLDFNSECVKTFKQLMESQVFISIPGAYSRKPPLAKLLKEYIPGNKPPKCIELFARELQGGWTSWGNEPLLFQDSLYFLKNDTI